jgi:2',3'-cyclic-nucleotide 2'-phosphodiesterase (5'-nucleotidase family)
MENSTGMNKNHLPLLGIVAVAAAVFGVLIANDRSPAPAPAAPPAAAVAAGAAPAAGAAAAAGAAPAAGAAAPAAAPAPAAAAAAPAAPAAAAADDGPAVQAGEVGLFFTSNAMGELIDCGCRQNPLGGLARRVRWINERKARYGGAVVVDTGGMLVADAAAYGEDAEQLQARADLYLAALAASGAAGVNIGAQELALPVEQWTALARKHGVALLSANLQRKGAPVFSAHRVVQIGGLKVGLFGLITQKVPAADKLVAGQGLTVTDPVAAAKAAVKACKAEGAQVIVALGQLRQDEIDDIGEKVPEVDFVLGSYEMDLTQRPVSLGRGLHLDPYNKGKWIGEVRLRPGKSGDRWYAPDLRDKLSYEQGSLQRQIAYYVEQFAKEDAPGATKTMNERERGFAEDRLKSLRIKLQRVNLELKGEIDPPEQANAALVEMHAVKVELPEDDAIRGLVQAHHKKWPPPAQTH